MSVLSGQVTVTTAGTAVKGPDTEPGEFIIRADPANTGYIYMGNNGNNDVDSTNGLKLAAGDVIIARVSNLNIYWFDSSVNGEKATWIKCEFIEGQSR